MWRLGALTNSEVAATLRAFRTRSRRELDLAAFTAWRTATLMRSRKIPALSRLLRSRKRRSAAEQDQIRSDIAAADAEFSRLEAEARARKEANVDGC